MSASTTSVLNTAPKLPDPAAAAQAMADLTAAVQDATLAAARNVGRPVGPVPYDPAPIAQAYAAFGMSLLSEPARVAEAQAKAWGEWMELWNTTARRAMGQAVEPMIQPVKGDRRFYNAAWSDEPVFDYVKQAYLLGSRQIQELIEGAQTLDDPAKAQVEFFTRQMLNAISPTNFPATNPEVL
ncbi:MAG TPA: hypothetical protein VEY30_08465, partial [Myxococcaceae bacterium]|nr:hypothetical protein [Myxococcaceae bacterium]